ncbi:phospholipase D-like domain-containing protein [Humibacter sp. RRB41]|uniref:phospholipase D-like domain-containing protein n=1 Tax=Humibacter sp. RRB41 TaxID=2919946 RepID=UPI001FAADF1A|nr:phospholipase D-like domain-containing protein [Humibacter sp. RRB41]
MATTREHIQRIIDAHLDAFRHAGVLSVRPGFRMSDGWITDERAIVATLAPGAEATAGLPDEIGGVPVDIRVASQAKLAQLGAGAQPRASFGQLGFAPDNGAVPTFADERVLTAPTEQTPVEQALKAPAKEQLTYTPPSGVSLSPVTATIRIELSASPDSGWPVLKEFLQGTEKSLTIGLYDFTSAHVLSEFETAAKDKTVSLVLDHPAKNPTADQTDDETVADLEAALGSGFDQVWALERADPHAAAWIFPSAYHIKTAVRDSNSVWLSSGNWNNSNQPDIDPVHNPADGAEARIRDRDWHVVIHDVALAGVFETYLRNDHAIAAHHQAVAPAQASEELFLVQPQVQTPPFKDFSAAVTLREQMTITPVLTPDPGVYTDAVRALIESAQTSLHLQFQYIEPPRTKTTTSAPFSALIDAVIARQKAGVDVKVIMSQFETSGYLEQLQELGLDVVHGVKLQNNVHNKGIVVDGARTLVSSQNWSTAGTLQNRDAGVIIESARVAAYFDAVFQHDWDNLARQKALQD